MNADRTSIRYELGFTEPWAHLLDVAVRVPVVDPGEPVELWMPVWTPGSYLVREYARHVEAFHAEGPGGASLSWQKTSKNRWEVDPAGAGEITVRYRVYGREMTVRNDWIEDGFALVNGAPTFLTVRGLEDRPHHVRFRVPANWAGVWTSLPSADPGKPLGDDEGGEGPLAGPPPADTVHAFVARDLDELVDSPFFAGTPAVYDFDVDGVPVLLLNEGETGLWDGAQAAADTKAIVEEYGRMYGGFPFPRYLFFNLITEARGGLEHRNCCVLMTSRDAFRRRKQYVDWLGLVSHEFFHVWNVKRSRPVALGPFDYEHEVYTRTLWAAEGITSYYMDLMVRRAGLITEPEFLEVWSRGIDRLQNVPGRALHSLEDSSFDSWIKLYRADENTGNTTVSYYTKGAVVSWLLDVEIRRATGGERSLDDFMRLLFERYAGDRGFTDEEVRAAAAEIAGRDLGDFFRRYVAGTGELDYGPALAYLGLRFKPAGEGSGDDAPRVWLGIGTRPDAGRLVVTSVRRDGPARDAGINVDDEILALGGLRVTPDTLADRLLQLEAGQRVEVLVARRGAVRIVPLTPSAHPGSPWRLEPDPEASEEAVRARESWLGSV